MGLWGKIKSTAKRATRSVGSTVNKVERAARPLKKSIRDPIKAAVKGTPIEATARALTDFDIRKPHTSAARYGYAVGSLVAAYYTDGKSLELTKNVDKAIYGKDVGSLSMKDLKSMENWVGGAAGLAEAAQGVISNPEQLAALAEGRYEDALAMGGNELGALRNSVMGGDWAAAERQVNGLRDQANGYLNQGRGYLDQAQNVLNTGAYRREGPPQTSIAMGHAINRAATGNSHMPIAASAIAGMGVPQAAAHGAYASPRPNNNTALLALGAVGLVLLLR
jgi:hypothetical protein